MRQLKVLKKEYVTEDRERYRPLLNVKKDLKDFYEDVEKEDKKSDISIKKEFTNISSLIHK